VNARARVRLDARVSIMWRLLRETGVPGDRYSEGELARHLGVSTRLVVSWIERGYLRASKLRQASCRGSYRIRRRAVRRAIADHPQVMRAVLKAAFEREAEEQDARSAG